MTTQTYRPTWDLSTIPDELLKSERARRNGVKSGGQPPRPKCPCGAMTKARAQKRRHVCVKTGG